MIDEEAHPRRFQTHLSTALILMIVAGVFTFLNLQAVPLAGPGTPITIGSEYGWPCEAVRVKLKLDPAPEVFDPFVILRRARQQRMINDSFAQIGAYSTYGFSIDIALAAATLWAVWFLCEWWIRRRQRQALRDER